MQIIFAGTPDFAAIILHQILEAGYPVKAVYTQPDRPSGRGRHLTPSPVKIIAIEQQIPIYQPITLRDKASQDQLAALTPDILIVAAYGLILPAAILQIPPLGCINVHASLLPHWRGAAPIQRSLLAGDKETGVSIMQMDSGMDTGAVLHIISHPIQPNDTAATLHNDLARLGATALLQCLPLLAEGTITAIPQDESQACYAPKIHKKESWINWSQSAVQLERQIRAFNPWPIAQTQIQNQILRIWSAAVLTQKTEALPGTVISANKTGINVATGDGRALNLLEVQPTGKRIMAVQNYLNARPLTPGTVLVSALENPQD
ncbi:methionyl-tRNA formyltransferase [Candidatus Nitrosoglobus terrae]|uniref:Methionyl-tRNA formyltransferase n=1 Tax=Candidatus Nitrosoglobus terrae TaxID=1630141 RepID=A0A1Q2SPI8_9GAMM|nr:methionyl-tRNA formyltransferase [Candidatus Nitrosoglobus terrae]BAW81017.1 methionyl-tRNA formyltransferase [Candidatus Nitrosoglobus terrae]